MSSVNILGQVKSSFIDYPSKICTVAFLGGCNFRCPYCHNPDIVNCIGEPIGEDEFLNFLIKRKKYLDGVCISGGEPTLSKGLLEFCQKIKECGYDVKLDTNGTNPLVLKKLIAAGLLDYIAMDIKGPLCKYEEMTKSKVNTGVILQSIDLIIHSNVPYEFRTTVAKELITENDLMQIINLIPNACRYCIQNFRNSEDLLGGDMHLTPYTPQELNKIKQQLSPFVKELIIR